MVTLILDCYGGDHSPKANVDGALKALEETPDLKLLLVGEEKGIGSELQNKKYDSSRCRIVDAPEVIDCHEAPTLAVFHRKNSSLVRSLDLLKDNQADGMVSLGNSGALLVGRGGQNRKNRRREPAGVLPSRPHDERLFLRDLR